MHFFFTKSNLCQYITLDKPFTSFPTDQENSAVFAHARFCLSTSISVKLLQFSRRMTILAVWIYPSFDRSLRQESFDFRRCVCRAKQNRTDKDATESTTRAIVCSKVSSVTKISIMEATPDTIPTKVHNNSHGLQTNKILRSSLLSVFLHL